MVFSQAMTQITHFVTQNYGIILAAGLGLAAIYLLLPRPRRLPILWGLSAASVSLLLLGWLVFRVQVFSMEAMLFYVFAAIAIVSGGMLVTVTNPARAAIAFGMVILATCGLFLLQAAPFLMGATIIVYGGAVIVTFLFILMLAQQSGLSDADARSREPLLSTITGFVLLVTLVSVLNLTYDQMGEWVDQTREAVLEAQALQQTEVEKPEELTEKIQGFIKRRGEQVKAFDDWWKKKWTPEEGKEMPLKGRALRDALFDARYAFEERVQKPNLGKGDLKTLETKLEVVWNLGALQQAQLRPTYKKTVVGDKGLQPGAPYAIVAVEQLSELSGPRSSRSASEIRRDAHGRPQLPAQNPAYIGRSLFSDYLLAVELGGLLLLVATVGAIAIASRRRDPAPEETPLTQRSTL